MNAVREAPSMVFANKATRLVASALSRRDMLRRAAVIGAAVSVAPFKVLLRPANAAVNCPDCSPSSRCCIPVTVKCCNLPGGSGVCPTGTIISGYWKISDTSCPNNIRYILDCNTQVGCGNGCRCANDTCSLERTCCFDREYFNCNQTTPMAKNRCRITSCTHPHVEYPQQCVTGAVFGNSWNPSC